MVAGTTSMSGELGAETGPGFAETTVRGGMSAGVASQRKMKC